MRERDRMPEKRPVFYLRRTSKQKLAAQARARIACVMLGKDSFRSLHSLVQNVALLSKNMALYVTRMTSGRELADF